MAHISCQCWQSNAAFTFSLTPNTQPQAEGQRVDPGCSHARKINLDSQKAEQLVQKVTAWSQLLFGFRNLNREEGGGMNKDELMEQDCLQTGRTRRGIGRRAMCSRDWCVPLCQDLDYPKISPVVVIWPQFIPLWSKMFTKFRFQIQPETFYFILWGNLIPDSLLWIKQQTQTNREWPDSSYKDE